jgi:2-polyprenyl-6-methoxyphenol hydroxylase-like FAD-dependent oxidoreductase
MASRGAGIVVQPQFLRLLRDAGAPELPRTSARYRRHLLPDSDGARIETPLQFTSWYAIYRTLKDAFPADRYHGGATVVGFDQTDEAVSVRFADRRSVKADLLVCADGSRSETRRKLMPEVKAHYVGYVAWRGTVEEEQAPTELVSFFDQSFTLCEGRSGGHILSYLIPGTDAATEEGRRHLNWVWYVRTPHGPELRRVLTDRNGVRHEASVAAGMLQDDLVAEVRALATRELHPRFAELVQQTRDPFIQAIIDVNVPRMAFGRTCLVGDAAFVIRPHPGAATAKAAADIMALAAALRAQPDDLPKALRAWETRQIDYGRALAELAIDVGKRSVEQRRSTDSLTELAERFRGISPVLSLE